jgi:hypothetical protein
MKKLAFTILLILFCASTLVGQARVTQEEYAVYAAVLRVIYRENRQTYSNKSHFVILKTTQIDPELDLPSGRRYRALVKDFKRMNLNPGVIERRLPNGAYSERYYTVTQDEIDELFKRGKIEFDKRYEVEKSVKGLANPGGTTWGPFYENFPEANGYYSLSRVGFDGIFAMVQVKREDVGRGFSRIYIMKRVKGKWMVVSSSGIEGFA